MPINKLLIFPIALLISSYYQLGPFKVDMSYFIDLYASMFPILVIIDLYTLDT